MRTVIMGILFLLLWPTIGLGGYHRSFPHAPYAYGPRYHSHHYHHNDWVVPLAVVGGVLGLVALTQMAAPPPPPPRLCRDTYNFYDEYGRFRSSRYVDRPCY